jgi:hypothetical protein
MRVCVTSLLFTEHISGSKADANIKLLKFILIADEEKCTIFVSSPEHAFQNHFSTLTWVRNKLFLLGWNPLWSGRSSRVHTTVLILGFLF